MQKIKNILFKQPFLSLAALCFAIAIASPFIFVDSQVSKTQTTSVKSVSSKAEATVTPTPLLPIQSGFEGRATNVQGATSVINTPTTATNQQISQPTATSVPPTPSAGSGQAAPAVQTFQVNLSINGSSIGSVTLDQGANQCDVLTKAKDQGKISQLLMKYVDSLGTNGVYQINGIGKDNVVWWVYKVNGISPGQGCSYIKANSGDSVEWDYQGN